MAEWQDIASAPRDRWIIVTDGKQVEPACWGKDSDDDGHVGWCVAGPSYGGVLYTIHYVLAFEPTHWLPLPTPPETNA